jgi:hypothetical protein
MWRCPRTPAAEAASSLLLLLDTSECLVGQPVLYTVHSHREVFSSTCCGKA